MSCYYNKVITKHNFNICINNYAFTMYLLLSNIFNITTEYTEMPIITCAVSVVVIINSCLNIMPSLTSNNNLPFTVKIEFLLAKRKCQCFDLLLKKKLPKKYFHLTKFFV